MPHPYQILDVFTDTPLEGNPLAVVFDADDLDTARMQAIAAEFNLSETAFLRAADDARHAAAMRIFTPTIEIPFAGHPTVGGAVAFALARSHATDVVPLSIEAGTVSCHVVLEGAGGTASFEAPVMPKVSDAPVDAASVAAALGLSSGDLGFSRLAPVRASAGPEFTVVPVASPDILARIALDRSRWREAFGEAMAAAYCIAEEAQGRFRARMFAPLAGIEEDPATGSAAVAFAALLGPRSGAGGAQSYTIVQGVEMGRRSTIELTVETDAGQLSRVRLSGRAVKVAEGTLLV